MFKQVWSRTKNASTYVFNFNFFCGIRWPLSFYFSAYMQHFTALNKVLRRSINQRLIEVRSARAVFGSFPTLNQFGTNGLTTYMSETLKSIESRGIERFLIERRTMEPLSIFVQ